jgi:hypothetical protein
MTEQFDGAELIVGLPPRLKRLIDCLQALGYRFANPQGVLSGPSPSVELRIARAEKLVGPLPAALATFYRTVGSVDLRGTHQEWKGCEYPDPLVVEPVDSAVDEAEQYAELENPREEYWASLSGVFRAPIGPDALHKAGVSGGMWYGVEVPNDRPDPLVLEEPHGVSLTGYLDLALKWGGFPGLARADDHTWPLDQLRRAAQ